MKIKDKSMDANQHVSIQFLPILCYIAGYNVMRSAGDQQMAKSNVWGNVSAVLCFILLKSWFCFITQGNLTVFEWLFWQIAFPAHGHHIIEHSVAS